MDTRRLLVTADDRTGALEVGGAVANEQFSVPVGPNADSTLCSVVDIGSRHVTPTMAAEKLTRIHSRSASFRCHKMDSGLRGNWPYETQALVSLGYRVAVVPSFPDAGRRCKDGVVYIQDVPVLDSPFAQDPLTAPVSNKPVEVLEHANCLNAEVEVWDANDNAELDAAIQRCREEQRVLVGPTGAIAGFANTVFPGLARRKVTMNEPVLVVCGSLNATSRDQISRLRCPVYGLDDDIDLSSRLSMLVTGEPGTAISNALAQAMASAVAARVQQIEGRTGTLFVIGGDTAAAIVGDETLEVLGTVDTGIPISKFRGMLLVTKGGGIGTADTVTNLLQPQR